MSEISELKATVVEAFVEIRQQFEKIDDRFDEMKEQNLQMHLHNEKRFDAIDKKFDEASLQRMNNAGAIINLSGQVQNYHHEMVALTNRFDRLEAKVDKA